MKIKTLFEQWVPDFFFIQEHVTDDFVCYKFLFWNYFILSRFKDHKKCSHMIASALDGDGTFTAAQISRKLRQLGLRIRKQKSGDNVHLMDEDGNDFLTEDAAESDGETLLSLKMRYHIWKCLGYKDFPCFVKGWDSYQTWLKSSLQ